VAWLAVHHNVVAGPAIGDDRSVPLACTWHDNLVRIANIGDGSCFIHAVLKAFYQAYQNNNEAKYRVNTAQQVRRDLGILLGSDNPDYPGHSYWETTGRSQFPALLMQEIVNESMINGPDPFLDYSLYGLQRFFNSYSWIGDESYNFISDAFNLDIFVMRINSTDVISHLHTKVPGKIRDAIVIVSNDSHYETLAVRTEQGLQTVFPSGDPFVEVLTHRFIGEGNFYDPQNQIEYDPDVFFVQKLVETFTNIETLTFAIPDMIWHRFSEQDPFVLCIDRLKDQINAESQRYMERLLARPINRLQAMLIRLEHQDVIPKDEIARVKQGLKPMFLRNEEVSDGEQLTGEQLIRNAMLEGIVSEDVGGILLDNI
jgi:hypothetical protein